MVTVVVPAQNEAGRITTVLRNLALLPIQHIILVVNGSSDHTLKEALAFRYPHLQIVYFHERLGIDVPRAIGAKIAYELGSNTILFVDGDMVGTFNDNLMELINCIRLRHLDIALTNCYPVPLRHIERCNATFQWRLNVNKALGLDKKLHLSTPSHGPHAISRKTLEQISFRELAIPPVMMALGRQLRLKIDIGTTLPHFRLGSSAKGTAHMQKLIDTIIGDCLEGIAAFNGEPRTREWKDKTYLGYHSDRRFDMIDRFLT